MQSELLVVVAALKHTRPYLYRQTFLLRIDHTSLVWLLSFKEPVGRVEGRACSRDPEHPPRSSIQSVRPEHPPRSSTQSIRPEHPPSSPIQTALLDQPNESAYS